MTIQILDPNRLKASTTITTTSCPSAEYPYLYDRSRLTKMTSVNQDDTVAEVITLDFGIAKNIGNILIDNHNFKTGTIKYWDGASYTDFSTPMAFSSNALATNYFQATAVSTTKIQISITQTIIANNKKFVGSIYCTNLIFTPEENPSEISYDFIEASIKNTMADGGINYLNLNQKYHATLSFSNITEADLTNFNNLKASGESFLFYPCGGRTDIANIGFRPYDIYLCNYINNLKPVLKGGLFNIGSQTEVELVEV